MPLWTCSSMDKCISMLRALRAQVKKCGANDLSPVPVAAPKVEHESVLRECELYQPGCLSALFLHASTDCLHTFQCSHIGIGSSL